LKSVSNYFLFKFRSTDYTSFLSVGGTVISVSEVATERVTGRSRWTQSESECESGLRET